MEVTQDEREAHQAAKCVKRERRKETCGMYSEKRTESIVTYLEERGCINMDALILARRIRKAFLTHCAPRCHAKEPTSFFRYIHYMANADETRVPQCVKMLVQNVIQFIMEKDSHKHKNTHDAQHTKYHQEFEDLEQLYTNAAYTMAYIL